MRLYRVIYRGSIPKGFYRWGVKAASRKKLGRVHHLHSPNHYYTVAPSIASTIAAAEVSSTFFAFMMPAISVLRTTAGSFGSGLNALVAEAIAALLALFLFAVLQSSTISFSAHSFWTSSIVS